MRHSRRSTNKSRRSLRNRSIRKQKGGTKRRSSRSKSNRKQKRKLNKSKRKSKRKQRGGKPDNNIIQQTNSANQNWMKVREDIKDTLTQAEHEKEKKIKMYTLLLKENDKAMKDMTERMQRMQKELQEMINGL